MIQSVSYESHKMENDIKRAKEELEELKATVENKNNSCMRELQPRINQLEEKIEFYWEGVKKMDQLAWKDL